MGQYSVIVHGGAGNWDRQSDRFAAAKAVCSEAVQGAVAVLESGGDAVAAAVAAAVVLENSPILNAGTGSVRTSTGMVEMDALLMDGRKAGIGAVSLIKHHRNPILIAKGILEDGRHHYLAGLGAEQFADDLGLARVQNGEMIPTEEQIAQEIKRVVGDELLAGLPETGNTIGAVVLDQSGNLASATSTGGTTGKMPGRIGDTPLPGAGGYAMNGEGAASATGLGETIMRVLLSKRVVGYIEHGHGTQSAAERGVAELESIVDGSGGIIAIGPDGSIGYATNTLGMPIAMSELGGSIRMDG